MDKKEIRTLTGSVEVREAADKNPVIEGYAAVFNDETVIGGQFAERVAPGAFEGARMDNTVALFNHDINQPLARVGRGLELSVDERGLKYRFEIGNQSYAKDLVENIRMGNVSTSSFGFTVRDDEWERRDDGLNLRTIKEVDLLFDVSPTTQGAYPTTEVGLRSMETALANQDMALIEEEEIRAEEEEEEKEEKAYGAKDEDEEMEEKSEEEEEEKEEKMMEDEEEEEEKEEEEEDEAEERVDQLVDTSILPHPYALDETTPEPEARNSNNSNSNTMENEKNAPAILQSRGDNQANVQKRYSFGKALREAAQGKLSGLEAEMNQEARGEFTDAKVNVAGGISVPSFLTENRAALAVDGTDNNADAFGGTIGKSDQGFAGFLHPNDIATQMGVRAVTGVSGNVVFQVGKNPPGTSDSTNEGASFGVSNQAFKAVDMGPKRIAAHVQVTEQLLAQTSEDLGAFVAAEIRKAVDAKFNATVVASVKAAATHRGAGTLTGFNASTRNALILEEELMVDNVDNGNIRVLASPTAYRKNRQLSLDAGSGLLFASSPADRQTVLGYQTVINSSVTAGELYMMDATRAVQCRWGGLNLIIDPYTDADKGVVRIIANVYRQFACLTNMTNRGSNADAFGGYGFTGYGA